MPVVGDREDDAIAFRARRQPDFGSPKLEGIGGEIDHHLLDAGRVPEDPIRKGRVDAGPHFCAARPWSEHRGDGVQHLPRAERGPADGVGSGLDGGEIEHLSLIHIWPGSWRP